MRETLHLYPRPPGPRRLMPHQTHTPSEAWEAGQDTPQRWCGGAVFTMPITITASVPLTAENLETTMLLYEAMMCML